MSSRQMCADCGAPVHPVNGWRQHDTWHASEVRRARCPHGKTEAHDVIVAGFPVPPHFRCHGPAASGTPEEKR